MIDGINSAEGVYINFLQVRGVVFVPVYDRPQDNEATTLLNRMFPGSQIVPVSSKELATGGGGLNCVSWNIRIEDA